MNMPWKSPPPKLAPIDSAAKAVLQHTTQAAVVALAPPPNHNFASLIDELGTVRAEIKRLKDREGSLAERVEALGPGDHDGTKCRAVVSTVTTMRLDTKSLTAALPEALVAAHTKASQSVRVSIKPLV